MAKDKSSNNITAKGNVLPESVQWLLDFANLNAIPGILRLNSVLEFQEVKRPPNEPPPHRDTPQIVPSFLPGLSGPIPLPDENGNLWIQATDGTSVYCGREDEKPSIKMVKRFLKKTKIKNYEDAIDLDLTEAWDTVNKSIFTIMVTKDDPASYTYCALGVENFIYRYYTYKSIPLPKRNKLMPNNLINGLEYPHDNTLTQVVCAYILDFWHNYRDLHQHLRQCKCCGKFWIEAGTRRKYCCKECEDRFNQASKQANRVSQANSRRWKKETVKKEIIKWLEEAGFPRKEAEDEYKKESRLHPNNVANLKTFQNTYARRTNLI